MTRLYAGCLEASMDADAALARLRDPAATHLAELAALVVDEALATPLRAIARPRWLVDQLVTALEAAFRGDAVRDRVVARIEEQVAAWRTADGAIGDFLPDDVGEPLREALARPWVPDEALVLRFIDQPVVRAMVREVLDGTVRSFRRRVGQLDKGVLGGVGSRVAARGRGLLGGVAGDLVGVVREEVEAQFDKRIDEFLGTATSEALRVMARHLADPAHAKSYGELRVATLHSVETLQLEELAGELDKLGVREYVDLLFRTVRSWLDDPAFADRATERVGALLDEAGDGTFGAWLDEVRLRDVWARSTTELLTERLRAVVDTDRFAAWWSALHA